MHKFINISYNEIKDTIIYEIFDYINEQNFNICQATGIILETYRITLNYNSFTRASYLLNISIESLKLGKVCDYIFNILDSIILQNFFDISIEKVSNKDKLLYQQDLEILKELKKDNKYKIIKTSISDKSRIEYNLNLNKNIKYINIM